MMKHNFVLALILVVGVMVIFSVAVTFGWGGETIRGAIIGHLAAWTEMVVIFYFRKKPTPGGG